MISADCVFCMNQKKCRALNIDSGSELYKECENCKFYKSNDEYYAIFEKGGKISEVVKKGEAPTKLENLCYG